MKKIFFVLFLSMLVMNSSAHAESVLTFPESLELIESQAFSGTSSEVVILPQGVQEIGEEAFMDSALKKVYLPASIKRIGEGAFSGCDELVAYVVPGSFAALWCVNAGIPTVELEQIPPIPVTGIMLDTHELTLTVEAEYKLKAVLTPISATADLCWTSSNPSIVEVSSDGTLTAIAPGTANIICEVCDRSGLMDMCQVIVKKKPNYRALLIGETGYSSRLKGPDNDVNAMASMLSGLEMDYHVISQIDATKAEIIDLIDYSFGKQGADDVSLFYYSGHGVTNSSTYYSGALMTIDVDYISTDELAEMLNAVEGRVIVILDSCGSGAAIRNRGANGMSFNPRQFNDSVINSFLSVDRPQLRSGEMRQEKFIVLTGSAYEEDAQTSNWGDVWGGLFTKCVVIGNGFHYLSSDYLGEAPADKDNNDIVTLSESQEYCQSYAGEKQHIQAWPEKSEEKLWYLPKETLNKTLSMFPGKTAP